MNLQSGSHGSDGAAATRSKGPRQHLPPALRHPPYRRYWTGAVASVVGYNLVYFAQLWLVHELTGSALRLGMVGAANAAPVFLLTLVGGVFADRVDRRTLIVGAQVVLAVLAAVMAVLVGTGTAEFWHILVIAVVAGCVTAFDIPARQAFFPGLVERESMTSAVALNSAVWQGARIAAPAVAGFVIAIAGTSSVFVIAAVGFAIMATLILSIRRPKLADDEIKGGPAEGLAEGLNYVRRRPEFRFIIGMVMFTSFFGGGYLILMPVFAVDILGVGPAGQGVLLAATGVGSLSATLWLSVRKRSLATRVPLVGGAALSGLSIAAFALSAQFVGSYSLSIGLMFAAGLFTSVYFISAMAALQSLVPERLRGRVMALYGISWSVMLLGGVQAGVIANFIGAPAAVAIGGLLITAFALGPALANRSVRLLVTEGRGSYAMDRETPEPYGR